MASAVKSREPWGRRWRRRALTIPGVLLGLVAVSATFPALLVAALLVDLTRPAGRRTLVSVRLAVFLWAFLLVETLGLALLGLGFLATLGARERLARLTWPTQRLYTGLCFSAAKAIFSLRVEVEGAELAAQGGPVLVLVRHASIVDVLVPGAFVANVHRLRLRYVLKRELLRGPCLDVAGQRIPNTFVARDGSDTPAEVEAVASLKSGIGRDDGVILFPEGTRFTEEKRRRALDKLRDDPTARARVEQLHHILPIRPGGTLALLEAAPACDVLVIGHQGLEGAATIADVWSGALVGRTVRVKMWREPASSIPEARADRLAWLDACWRRLDAWIASV